MSFHNDIVEKAIEPGQAVALTPWVQRITAPNPSVMTGPGTNTYLIGQKKLAVLDPGPAIDSHIEAILAAGGDRIHYVVATHTHPDHSPAAVEIVKRTGATLIGATIADDGHQDTTFKPDIEPIDGYRLAEEEYHLEAVFTPGHVGNHFCFYLKEDKLLFTGDHIMEGTTVVIIPPYGDMKDYIESLEKLKNYELEFLAPAHGHLIQSPNTLIDKLVKHRLGRESFVVDALQKLGAGDLNALLPSAYADVDKKLYPIAKFSLWAHLLKLEKEQRVRTTPVADYTPPADGKNRGDGVCWHWLG